MLGLKGRPMFERDFTPLFKLEHMLKDVRHCLARRARWAWNCAWDRSWSRYLRRLPPPATEKRTSQP